MTDITPEDSVVTIILEPKEIENIDEVAPLDAMLAQLQAIQETRTTAISRLLGLGFTEEEISALFGIPLS